MTSITFQADRESPFSSTAAQQDRTRPAAPANNDCSCTDTCQAYVTRGIFYGLLISAPLWVVLGGSVYLACRMMG